MYPAKAESMKAAISSTPSLNIFDLGNESVRKVIDALKLRNTLLRKEIAYIMKLVQRVSDYGKQSVDIRESFETG